MARSAFETFEAVWLRGVFMRALGAAVAASLGAAGCSSSSEPFPCEESKPLDLADVKPATPFDFAAIRAARPDAGATEIPDEWTSSGEPCSGAKDATACLAELNASPPKSVFEVGQGSFCGPFGCIYVVTTSGDKIEYFKYIGDELLAFLGPIDSREDARLWLDGAYAVECGETRVEREGDGFRVTTLKRTSSCPSEFSRVTVQVSADGKVTVLDTKKLPFDEHGPCP